MPHIYIENLEAENVILERKNLPLHNIRKYAIGKGILYLISDGTPNFLPPIQISSIEIVNDTWSLLGKYILKKNLEKEERILDFIVNPTTNHDLSPLINKLESDKVGSSTIPSLVSK